MSELYVRMEYIALSDFYINRQHTFQAKICLNSQPGINTKIRRYPDRPISSVNSCEWKDDLYIEMWPRLYCKNLNTVHWLYLQQIIKTRTAAGAIASPHMECNAYIYMKRHSFLLLCNHTILCRYHDSYSLDLTILLLGHGVHFMIRENMIARVLRFVKS